MHFAKIILENCQQNSKSDRGEFRKYRWFFGQKCSFFLTKIFDFLFSSKYSAWTQTVAVVSDFCIQIVPNRSKKSHFTKVFLILFLPKFWSFFLYFYRNILPIIVLDFWKFVRICDTHKYWQCTRTLGKFDDH